MIKRLSGIVLISASLAFGCGGTFDITHHVEGSSFRCHGSPTADGASSPGHCGGHTYLPFDGSQRCYCEPEEFTLERNEFASPIVHEGRLITG